MSLRNLAKPDKTERKTNFPVSFFHFKVIHTKEKDLQLNPTNAKYRIMKKIQLQLSLLGFLFFSAGETHATNITVSLIPSVTICIGQCVSLSALASGGTPPYTYSWTHSGLPVSLTSCPDVSSWYKVIATDHNGLVSNGDSVHILVNPPLEVICNSNATVCPGSSVQLMATASGGNSTYSYSWIPSTGLNNPNIQNPLASPGTPTTYTAIVSDNCGTPTDSSFTTVTVYPSTQTAISVSDTQGCVPFCVHFLASSIPACANAVWAFGDGAMGTGCDSTQHCFTVSGLYSANFSVTDIHGCKGNSSVQIPVLVCAGVQADPDLESTLKLYPNPFKDQVTFQFEAYDKNRRIVLYDATGKKVFGSSACEQTITPDLVFLPRGLYYLQVTSGQENSVRKISKQ